LATACGDVMTSQTGRLVGSRLKVTISELSYITCQIFSKPGFTIVENCYCDVHV